MIEICIPAFNEEGVIAEAVEAVRRVFRAEGKAATIIVSDNGSTDGTARAAEGIEGVKLIRISMRGKGAAVVAASRASRADVFGFIDADLSADPAEIPKLLSAVERGLCDIAIGSRLADGATVDRGAFNTLSSRLFNAARKVILGIKEVQDTQCGLKLMNVRGREILSECTETGWYFDIEFLARAKHAGLRIREIPISWNEFRFPGRKSKLNHFRDGLKTLPAFFRIWKNVRL